MDKKEKIFDFDLLRVNRGRKKICQCDPPHYDMDTVNRIVMCRDCGAVVDPFDALLSVASDYYEKYREDIKRLRNKAEVYANEADKEQRRMRKSRIFREMEESYRKNMFPCCPICEQYFDPMEITNWRNAAYIQQKNAKKIQRKGGE